MTETVQIAIKGYFASGIRSLLTVCRVALKGAVVGFLTTRSAFVSKLTVTVRATAFAATSFRSAFEEDRLIMVMA